METLWRTAASIIWLMTAALVLVRTNRSACTLYRVQALGEATLAGILAQASGDASLWFAVVAVLVLKVIVVPAILQHAHPSLGKDYGSRSPLGMTTLAFAMAGLTIAGILIGPWIETRQPLVTGILFGSWLIALMQTSARYETWSLAWALLSLDTLSGSLALVVGNPLPELADLSIVGASIALALMLALLIARIAEMKKTTDVRNLKELTG